MHSRPRSINNAGLSASLAVSDYRHPWNQYSPTIMPLRHTLLIISLLLFTHTTSAQDFDAVEIGIEKITDSIYMLTGSGGNIGLSVGEDGAFIVDDQFAPLTEKIKAVIAQVSDHQVGFVINTHWHHDHSDGNEHFGGDGAIIVSHEKSRARMQTDQLIELFDVHQKAYEKEGLPKITFDESVRFHLNGETVDVFHPGVAHTDGDAIVFFRDSNVMHAGDVFVTYGLPFIDVPNGGSIDGLIAAVGVIAERSNDETVFIPGHGPISSRDDLVAFGEMLVDIRDGVMALMDEGRTLEQIIKINPASGHPAEGVDVEAFLGLVYEGLKRDRG